ncbi:vWA domain-containing protein [Paracoccus alkanivorans]|uniref:VWA domain-containing protein n=1 Tax=Paracoccus alkanivorans TaxID=2116655 RepID=A0A3M0MK24_9RHOB|nr:vWA domain-containing protein [Paracoccus alkanivorans]RMC36614.1 VWA domain-containing protein [Paracoccus alkanivorans]
MRWRVVLPATVTGLALLAALGLGIPRKQHLTDALVVVDITRSMNVRDMQGESRLDYVRRALRDWIAARPCGSRIGLALFTERRSVTLFEPVEICADFSSVAGSLAGLDWRMAWEGDSMISKGLDYSLDRARELGVPLIFVTDGHEAPPLPYAGPAGFAGDSPGGLILGVGGDAPAPIPKFDDLGREVGFYDPEDVQHAPARIGAPPSDASERPGYHPRNNPYGESDLEGNEHLSELRQVYLQDLAEDRELGFLRLADGGAAIDRALLQYAPTHSVRVTRSLSPLIGAAGLLLLIALWLAGHRGFTRTERRFHDYRTHSHRGFLRRHIGVVGKSARSYAATGRRDSDNRGRAL